MLKRESVSALGVVKMNFSSPLSTTFPASVLAACIYASHIYEHKRKTTRILFKIKANFASMRNLYLLRREELLDSNEKLFEHKK